MSSKDPLAPIVEILAAFAAARRYSYLDRVGNSLEPLTALEAIRDALRDFDSSCRRGGLLYEDRDEGICVPCPKIDSEELKNSIGFFEAMTRRGKREFLELTRKLSIRALSRASEYKGKC